MGKQCFRSLEIPLKSYMHTFFILFLFNLYIVLFLPYTADAWLLWTNANECAHLKPLGAQRNFLLSFKQSDCKFTYDALFSLLICNFLLHWRVKTHNYSFSCYRNYFSAIILKSAVPQMSRTFAQNFCGWVKSNFCFNWVGGIKKNPRQHEP